MEDLVLYSSRTIVAQPALLANVTQAAIIRKIVVLVKITAVTKPNFYKYERC